MGCKQEIAVIIPAYNCERTVGACLDSLAANTGARFDVLAVEDHSTDGTLDRIEKCGGCRLLQTPRNSGPGSARNLGARISKAPILLFLDADCVAPRDWVAGFANAFENHGEVDCICSGYNRSMTEAFWARFQFLDTRFNQRNTPNHPRWASSANFGCRRNAFWEVGGFPEIYINEDMIFFHRLSQNHRLLWIPEFGVGHHFHGQTSRYLKQQFKWSGAVVATFLENPEMARSKGTVDQGNIRGQLLLSAGVWAGFGASILSGRELGAGFAFLCAMAVAALNVSFLRYLKSKTSIGFCLRSLLAVMIRNTVWLSGMAFSAAANLRRWPGFFHRRTTDPGRERIP
jgi:glycosyltransferase involved in cell wall biosynthesis